MGNPSVIDFTTVFVNNAADGRRKLGIEDFDTGMARSTTDQLREGKVNLYWTQARFNTAFKQALSTSGAKGPKGDKGDPGDILTLFEAIDAGGAVSVATFGIDAGGA